MTTCDRNIWLAAETRAQPRRLFVLWNVHEGFCQSVSEFEHHFGPELQLTIEALREDGLIEDLQGVLVLTASGHDVVRGFVEIAEEKEAPKTTFPLAAVAMSLVAVAATFAFKRILGNRQSGFALKVIGDSSLRPVLDAALKRISRDQGVRVSYFFASGTRKSCDAVLLLQTTPPPTKKPWRSVDVAHAPFDVAVERVTAAIRHCMDEADSKVKRAS